MSRSLRIALLLPLTVFLLGCPKGHSEYSQGRKAEEIQDWDTALIHYQHALAADPTNVEYKLRVGQIRFEAAAAHVKEGQKQLEKGEPKIALAEFEKAMAIDPSSPIAGQEARKALDIIAGKPNLPGGPPVPSGLGMEESRLLERPPDLKPLSREPVNLKMTNDARIVYETLGKLAGLTVIFDPDIQSRRITTELTNVTIEQALDVVALESKTFWKPVTANIIFVVPEQAQKRKDYDDFIVKTFYLANTVQPQELTEIVAGLRQIADLHRVQQITSQNAIVIRDTPDKIAVVEKVLRDVDRAKPEVVVQVSVMQARSDRVRDLGITPGSSAVLAFTPRNPTGSTSSSGSSGSTGTSGTTATGTTGTNTAFITLQQLGHLSSADYSISLPGATAMALLTDATTKIIVNPEIRVVDGQSAKLRIGDRIPIATGSFQAGLGATTSTAGVINPLVNTQFQYQDVGVNIDITPRIHLSREISLKVVVEVSAVTGQVNIGGINQPIISQRKIEHDVRLKEGEVSILGGLLERTQTKSINGWPGFAQIPFLRYFFSGENVENEESEVLMVLKPQIVRLPELSAENLKSLSTGTDTIIQVRRGVEAQAPAPAPVQAPAPAPAAPPAAAPSPAGTPPAGQGAPGVQVAPPAPAAAAPGERVTKLRFEPAAATVKAGDTTTVGLVVEDVKDLYSLPVLITFNPNVVMVEEIRQGGFLSGGTQPVALVQRVDKERGQAIISAARPPNTGGVSGTGTVLGIVVRGVAKGTSPLSIVQVSARNSQQQPIPIVSSEASLQVQ
jgi:general secretion pathway protein D